jgi:hypothetical protein
MLPILTPDWQFCRLDAGLSSGNQYCKVSLDGLRGKCAPLAVDGGDKKNGVSAIFESDEGCGKNNIPRASSARAGRGFKKPVAASLELRRVLE